MLIGARDPAEMTAAQKAVFNAIAQGPRKGVPAPFLAMLDMPEPASAIQAVGAALRFAGVLPATLREIAILATAAAFGSGYEWDYHLPIAREAGVDEPVIAMAATGDASGAVGPAAQAVIGVCRDAVLARSVDEHRLAPLVEAIGRAGASEVVAIAGYYQLLGLFLSAAGIDHHPRL